jgi:hypothetical protein
MELNKDTVAVGLEFNVKPFRKWMKEHYERQSKKVGVINAHYILASVDQILTFSLLHGMSEYFQKNDSGIYVISLDNMMTYVRLTPYLNNTYHYHLSKYDDTLDYQKQLCIDRKSFDKYINKYIFNDNFRLSLSKSSMNFLCYLLVQANTMLANTALIMSEFAKKSRVNNNAINASLKVHFSGKLYEDIMKKIDSVETLLKNKDKQDSEKEEKESEEPKKEKETNNDSDKEESDKEESDKEASENEESDKESDKESEENTDKEESDDEDKPKITTKNSNKNESKPDIKNSSKTDEKPVKKNNKKK